MKHAHESARMTQQTTATAAAARAAAAHGHAKGLVAALVTALVLGAVSLASDETFLVEYLGRDPTTEYDPYDTLPWISYEQAVERMEAAERMKPPPSRQSGGAGDGDGTEENDSGKEGDSGDGDDSSGLILVHDLLIRVGEFRDTHSGGDVFGDRAFGEMTAEFEGGHMGGACGGHTYYMRSLAEYAVAKVRRVTDTRLKYCTGEDEDEDGEEQRGSEEPDSTAGEDGGDGPTIARRLLRMISSPPHG